MSIKTKILNFFRFFFKIKFIENLLRILTLNKQSTSFICKFVPNNYQYKSNTMRIFNYKGVILKVDISDYIGHYLYFGFKDTAQERLFELVKEGDCILDIGTNIGSTVLQFTNKTKDKGFVYGFEPDLFNLKRCKANIGLNKFKNISVDNIGLGDKKGEFKLYIDTESNRGGNRIKQNDKNNKKFSIIKVERLDDWVKTKNITNIDLIKIDVEGFEMNVLIGGIDLIKKYKPILFIELDDNNLKDIGSTANDLISFLEKIFYKITNAETRKIVTSKDNFDNCHYDIIAENMNK